MNALSIIVNIRQYMKILGFRIGSFGLGVRLGIKSVVESFRSGIRSLSLGTLFPGFVYPAEVPSE